MGVLAGTWGYWFIIGWYCLILGGKGLFCLYVLKKVEIWSGVTDVNWQTDKNIELFSLSKVQSLSWVSDSVSQTISVKQPTLCIGMPIFDRSGVKVVAYNNGIAWQNMFWSYQNQQQAANPHDLKLQSRFHRNFIFLPKSTEQMTEDSEISIAA